MILHFCPLFVLFLTIFHVFLQVVYESGSLVRILK